jgi:hypothetical protein
MHLPVGPDRGIVTADHIIADLRLQIRLAQPGQVVTGDLPSFNQNIHFLRLFNTPISALLVPESGFFPQGSIEAEQMKALKILLGDSRRFLKFTPLEVFHTLRERSDSGVIDIRSDHTFGLSLLTTLGNAQTGEKLYYTLNVEYADRRRGVAKVRQSLHSRNVSEVI